MNEINAGASGGSRILKRRFHGLVDPRRRGLGVQPPAAEEVLIFKNTLSIEIYYKLHINSDSGPHVQSLLICKFINSCTTLHCYNHY